MQRENIDRAEVLPDPAEIIGIKDNDALRAAQADRNNQRRSELVSQLSNVRSLVEGVSAAAQARFREGLDEASGLRQDVSQALSGLLMSGMRGPVQTLQQSTDRVRNRINSRLAEAFGFASVGGVTLPNLSEIPTEGVLINPFTGQRATPLPIPPARIQNIQEVPPPAVVQWVRWRHPDGREACVATDAPRPGEEWEPVAVYDDYDTCLQNLPAQAPAITPPPEGVIENVEDEVEQILPQEIVTIPPADQSVGTCPQPPVQVQCPPPQVSIVVQPPTAPGPTPGPGQPPTVVVTGGQPPTTQTTTQDGVTPTPQPPDEPTILPPSEEGKGFAEIITSGILGVFSTQVWCRIDVCDIVDEVATYFGQATPGNIEQTIGLRDEFGDPATPEWMEGFYSDRASFPVKIIGYLLETFLRSSAGFMGSIVSASGCTSPAYPAATILLNLLKILERFIGFDIPPLRSTLSYFQNYACPSEIPSADQSAEAWLADQIEEKLYRCWVSANGVCPEPFHRVVLSRQTRPGITESVTLYNRGEITEEQYRKLLRENGVLSDEYARLFTILGQQTPNATDLVQFMVKDAFDEVTSKELDLDSEFTRKFTAEAEQLFASAGIDESFARLIWRSHWQQPSVGQMFEMLHRLRPGLYGPEVSLTEDQVLRFLGVQDILPFWRKRLLEISYNPLTRVDTQRAFFIGSIDRNEVLNSYLDQGYSPANAERLTRFTELLKLRYDAGQSGALTPTKASKLFKSGALSKAQYESVLRKFGYGDVEIAEAVRVARELREVEVREACNRSAIARFRTGDLDLVGLQTKLIDNGVDPEDAVAIARGAQCKLQAKGRSLTADKLCQVFERGLIPAEEFSVRLVRLGYNADDARRLVALCQLNLSDKISKRLEQLQRQRIAQAEKLKKEREKLEKESEKQREKRLKDIEKRSKEEQKAAEKRTKELRQLEERQRKEAQKRMQDIGKRLDKLLKQQSEFEQSGEPVPVDLQEEIDYLQSEERRIELEDLQ